MGKQFRIPAELSGGKARMLFEGLVEMDGAVKSAIQGDLQHSQPAAATYQTCRPIIQNGKLVGVVTHVLVNDPTTEYGIFIENMLDAAA